MKHSLYHIHYKPEGARYRLYNHDEPCGPRLVKSDGFPFQRDNWWYRDTENEAQYACEHLQIYLDKHEAKKPATGGESK